MMIKARYFQLIPSNLAVFRSLSGMHYSLIKIHYALYKIKGLNPIWLIHIAASPTFITTLGMCPLFLSKRQSITAIKIPKVSPELL